MSVFYILDILHPSKTKKYTYHKLTPFFLRAHYLNRLFLKKHPLVDLNLIFTFDAFKQQKQLNFKEH